MANGLSNPCLPCAEGSSGIIQKALSVLTMVVFLAVHCFAAVHSLRSASNGMIKIEQNLLVVVHALKNVLFGCVH